MLFSKTEENVQIFPPHTLPPTPQPTPLPASSPEGAAVVMDDPALTHGDHPEASLHGRVTLGSSFCGSGEMHSDVNPPLHDPTESFRALKIHAPPVHPSLPQALAI